MHAEHGRDPDHARGQMELQANKSMISLWKGRTIFTFADESLKKDTEVSSSGQGHIQEARRPATLPLASGRLSQPEEASPPAS